MSDPEVKGFVGILAELVAKGASTREGGAGGVGERSDGRCGLICGIGWFLHCGSLYGHVSVFI